jgi:hypothetical protein
MYLIFALVFFAVITALAILSLSSKYREKIREQLTELKKRFVWNGVIRSVYIAYAELCMTVATQLIMFTKGSIF